MAYFIGQHYNTDLWHCNIDLLSFTYNLFYCD
jgi:hypothetical protein